MPEGLTMTKESFKRLLEQQFNPYLHLFENMWVHITRVYPRLRDGGFRGWWQWMRSHQLRAQCYHQREFLDCIFAYAIPNDEALSTLAALAPLIEIGAGNGYWAWLLRKMGVDVYASDSMPIASGTNPWFGPIRRLWTEVCEGDAKAVAEHPARTLFMCWPPHDMPMGSAALEQYKGKTLVYVGHCASGNTGDPEFHVMLDRFWQLEKVVVIPCWHELQDQRVWAVPTGLTWGQVSRFCDDGRDKMFVFKRA